MVEVLDADSVGEVNKSSGRKGQRLTSLQEIAEEEGLIHPQYISEKGDVEAIILKHSTYSKLCDERDHLPDGELTQGVKSGLTDRYDVEFGMEVKGKGGQFMVLPNTDDFSSLMSSAQAELDKALEEEEEEED